MYFRTLLVALLSVLVACASEPKIVLDPAAASVGDVRTVFVSTTRDLDENGVPDKGRSEQSHYFRYEISVPPDRPDGSIETPKHKVNAKTDFVATSAAHITSKAAFKSEIANALRQRSPEHREVQIYVHGFNNSFDESVLRMAQLGHDFQYKSVTIAYAWPSAGHVLEYEYDRDSNLFARDGLEDLINTALSAGANSILLVAHSMGTQLVMETLRQMDIRSPGSVARDVNYIMLISPDIGVDVFKSQVRQISKLPENFFIFVSHEDKLLKLSSVLSGEPDRVGNLKDFDELADIDVQIIDVTNFSSGLGHDLPGDSPALIKVLNNIGSLDSLFEDGNTGLGSAVVLTVTGATETILSPVTGVNQ